MKTMDLYHGTSNTFIDSILSKGLKPRGKSKGNWFGDYQAKSHSEFVYLNLINGEGASFHALRTAFINKADKGLIVKVEVDEINLYPDENWLSQKDVDGFSIYKREYAKAKQKIKNSKDSWKSCLEKIQMVAHQGRINKFLIKDVIVIKNEENMFSFLLDDCKSIEQFDIRCQTYSCELAKIVSYEERLQFFQDFQNRKITFEEAVVA
jgi:hypothetical protein